jgi:hypothetical protein
MRKSRKQDGVIIQRKARPADAVIYSSHIASTSITILPPRSSPTLFRPSISAVQIGQICCRSCVEFCTLAPPRQ